MTRRSQDRPQSVRDDGQVLELDLHGCAVDTALSFVSEALRLASRRGRGQVSVVHGLGGVQERQIRDMLRRDGFHFVTASGRTVVSLDLAGRVDPTRISAADLAVW